MKIGELATLIPELYEIDKSSLLFLGPPGIGKSTGVNEAAEIIAKSLGKECINYSDQEADRILADPDKFFLIVDFRLTEAEPSDFLGIPPGTERRSRLSPASLGYVPFKSCGHPVS